jgi:hypothetical protein
MDRQIMSRLISDITRRRQDRKSENKKGSEPKGFSHYNTNQKIEPLAWAQTNETL